MEKLSVLFLPAWYPSKFNKVGGVFVREHAKAINEQIQLAVLHICEHPHLRKPYDFEETIEGGILTYRIYYRKFSAKWLKPVNILLFSRAAIIGYKKVKKRFNPDLNHVHVLTRMGVLALLAKLIYQTPFVITEHWSRYLPERDSYNGMLRKWVTKLVVKNSFGVSAVTFNLKKAMVSNGLVHQNSPVISNVVDTELFKPNGQPREGFVFLHVSGLNDNVKNISGILRAFQNLLSEIDGGQCVKLVMVGDDDLERPILENYAKELGLDKHVFFVGKKYGKDLVAEYQKANAFVMFSNFENQPCVILEAMSCGLPIISSSVGGIPEIIDEKIGTLVAARDERGLKQAMLNMYRDSKGYDNHLIRKIAEENFAYPAVCSKLMNFYHQALAGQN